MSEGLPPAIPAVLLPVRLPSTEVLLLATAATHAAPLLEWDILPLGLPQSFEAHLQVFAPLECRFPWVRRPTLPLLL